MTVFYCDELPLNESRYLGHLAHFPSRIANKIVDELTRIARKIRDLFVKAVTKQFDILMVLAAKHC